MQEADEVPSTGDMADIVALVADTMFGRALTMHAGDARPPAADDRAAGVQLALEGERTFCLRACWQQPGGRAPAGEPGRAELGELLNIVAGQVKGRYLLTSRLGLPEAWQVGASDRPPCCGVRLDSREGGASLWVQLDEETSGGNERPR